VIIDLSEKETDEEKRERSWQMNNGLDIFLDTDFVEEWPIYRTGQMVKFHVGSWTFLEIDGEYKIIEILKSRLPYWRNKPRNLRYHYVIQNIKSGRLQRIMQETITRAWWPREVATK